MPPDAAAKPMPPRATKPQVRGYTLLEIALVVTIIVLLIGAVVPLTSGFTREQRLRDVVRELLVLAKTARTDAMTTGRAAEVVFVKGGFVLQRASAEEAVETFRLPRGMTYQIRPFASDKILKPDEQRWIFQPSGLCEPITLRVMEDEAWIEVRFDALTAGLAEESYNIP
jgi:type II secretory pathway pseudopilin PulG